MELFFYETDVTEEGMTEERLETRDEASLAEVLQIVTTRLVAFFGARGCKPTVAEAPAQKGISNRVEVTITSAIMVRVKCWSSRRPISRISWSRVQICHREWNRS